MKKIIYIFIFFSIVSTSFAQLPGSGISLESNVLDGVYIQEHIPTKRVVSYTHLREADVMWAKRIWRVIDLKEKMNSNYLVLVRHGQSEWNEKNLFTGWRDPGLTQKGIEEAHKAGVLLRGMGIVFDVMFTSELHNNCPLNYLFHLFIFFIAIDSEI